ncbi:hypothetical protein AND_008503 [Anopheles darlingi]|uniref:DUF753 domain-containing protein n=1 Tax=Anopheles darlingi TaxID=43151 RepID=W5J638_ANODA|nr:hypothetical protein AND_008503 [Anopheles darlingi]
MYKYLAIVAVVLACNAGSTSAYFCFNCTTAENPNCLNPDTNNLMLECPPSPLTSCFTRIVGQHVVRGCAAALSQTEVGNCNEVNNCQLCTNDINVTPVCNGNLFPHGRLTCHHCEGPTNSSECSEEISTPPRPCLLFQPDDQCFVQVESETVIRGCTSSNTGCSTNRNCHTCSGNGCNFRHFEHSAAGSLMSIGWVKLLVGAITIGVAVGHRS